MTIRRPAVRFYGWMGFLVVAGWSMPGLGAQPPTVVSHKTLFTDLELPYTGLGAVWIRSDGLVIVEMGDAQGFSFYANLSPLFLVSKDDTITFKHTDQVGEVLHRFQPAAAGQGENCDAILRLAGDLEVDYDEEVGRMHVQLSADKRTFVAVFEFVTAQNVPESGGEDAANGQSAGQNQCSCTSSGCSSSKTCPPGYHCSCRCTPTICTCGPCVKIRAIGVEVLFEDGTPAPPEPN